MIRGTTPTHIFRLPIDTGTIKELRITYRQLGHTVLEKTEADVETQAETVQFTLTQEEALLFRASYKVDLQVKVLLAGGAVMASKIMPVSVSEILNEEVLA